MFSDFLGKNQFHLWLAGHLFVWLIGIFCHLLSLKFPDFLGVILVSLSYGPAKSYIAEVTKKKDTEVW